MASSPVLKPSPDITLKLSLSSSPSLQTLKSEERGIHLIHLLLTCATHVSSGNFHQADAILHRITELSCINGDSIQRLSARFGSALAIRLVKRWPGLYRALNPTQPSNQEPERTQFAFARALPYLRFGYDIINRTLIRTMIDEHVIHIVNLGSGDPNLWGPLLRAFVKAPNGPPHLKITCICSHKNVLANLGPKLGKVAEALCIPFQFNPINIDLKNLTIDMIKIRSGEALAITSVLNLHVLLAEDDRVEAHFETNNNAHGAKDSKRMKAFLEMVRSISPKILLLVEQESDHNLTRVSDRFLEALYYYSALFDSIEANLGYTSMEDRLELEEMFGRQIENIVACEGVEREERHERYVRWMVRFGRAGFKPIRLWCEGMEHGRRLVEGYEKDGYKIVSEKGSLMICWHDRPLYAVSAWA